MRTILYILMVITSFWLISCGASKSEKNKSEEKITGLESVNIINSDWSKAFENYFSKDNTITVVREKFINGAISEKETITKNDKTETRQNTKETKIYRTYDIYRTHKINVVSSSKKTDKKQWNPFNLGWFILGVAIYLVIKYWDKITSKTWWV